VIREGGRCSNGEYCGTCEANCGKKTEAHTCAAYGYSVDHDDCNISAAGGGGNQCGKTTICCVVWTPTKIVPGADGTCLPKRP
jgi:hypothetical protein